jgi:hypothetical protein
MWINIWLQLWHNDPLWVADNPKYFSIGPNGVKENNKDKPKKYIQRVQE